MGTRLHTKLRVLTQIAESGNPNFGYLNSGTGFAYADGSLQQHEFFLSDHLGNTRVIFADLNGDGELDFSAGTAEVLQTNSYYPFGMPIEGMTPMDATDPAQHYLYNGKERSLLAGLYDYGARWYDPSIGRWGVVDPLADQYVAWSAYNYTYNNPLRFTDPDGRSADDIIIKGERANDAFRELQASSSLTLSMDQRTGKLSATGTASNSADEKLLQAINDKTVRVELTATDDKVFTDRNGERSYLAPLPTSLPPKYKTPKLAGVSDAMRINVQVSDLWVLTCESVRVIRATIG